MLMQPRLSGTSPQKRCPILSSLRTVAWARWHLTFPRIHNRLMRPQTLRKIRLASQVIFFGLFAFLLFQTEFHGSLRSAAPEIRLPYPVGIFLEADPLIAFSNALSTHALYRGLI